MLLCIKSIDTVKLYPSYRLRIFNGIHDDDGSDDGYDSDDDMMMMVIVMIIMTVMMTWQLLMH